MNLALEPFQEMNKVFRPRIHIPFQWTCWCQQKQHSNCNDLLIEELITLPLLPLYSDSPNLLKNQQPYIKYNNGRELVFKHHSAYTLDTKESKLYIHT